MPFMYGSGASHDDQGHFGSAKRDVASGVAGLSSTGYVLGKTGGLLLTRDGNNDIAVGDRSSGEFALYIRRLGANTYAFYRGPVAGGVQLQDSSMKDVASGIVAQDASGNATVTGPKVLLTRDGSNEIYISERTSTEPIMKVTRKAAGIYQPYLNTTPDWRTFAVLDTNGDIPHMRPKVASANLRHSHDAEVIESTGAWVNKKTITFKNGISGTLRVAFDLKRVTVGAPVLIYGQVRKNGANIGALQSDNTGAYVTKTEDIAMGVLAPGDTIELWLMGDLLNSNAYAQNFRISYDNAADTVLVAGVSNS